MPLGTFVAVKFFSLGYNPAARRQPAASSKAKPAAPVVSKPLVAPAAPVATELPSALAAPQTVQLRGTVPAPDGRPRAGASVYPAGSPRQLVVTDAQGAFTLPVRTGTPLALRVDYFGEGSSRVEVPAPGATTAPLRIMPGQ